jgi:radical SAM protein with 4Fe4S-binding SPASM domain
VEGPKKVASKKRWQQIYSDDNPFELLQLLSRGVKNAARDAEGKPNRIRYLWAYVTESGISSTPNAERQGLSTNEWLSLIDELAALGCEYIVLSCSVSPSKAPHVWEIVQWAQDAHQMNVAVHVYGEPLTQADATALASLDQDKLVVLADPHLLEACRFLEDRGIPVDSAAVQEGDTVEPECKLPEEMACVDAEGRLYTCGLVLGEEQYHMGNAFSRRLERAMDDESVPHRIPEGLPKVKRSCNGCPPLIERLIEQREEAKEKTEA